jgi:beta-glucanase (GH16 family)
MRNLFTLLAITFLTSIFSQQNVLDDFEGNGTITTWAGDDCGMDTTFSNPFKTDVNNSKTVLKYTDEGGQYANVRFNVPANFDLSTNNTFSLKIYVPSASITGSEKNQISLKLQDGKIGAPWSTQSEIIKTIVLNQWQTITFDFANDNFKNYNENSENPINRKDFNRVLIQINDEDNKSNVTAYIDDFLYDGTIAERNNSGTDPVFDTLVWSDNFDGVDGQIVDLDNTKWFKQTYPILGGNSWANGEVQHYTNRTDNSFVSNGTLKILAKRETYQGSNKNSKNFTSARLNSKFAFTYGKVEIRAKMPFGVGTFPALWMLGQNITETGGYWAENYGTTGWPDCGEIDIIEHWGDNQNFVQSAMHNRSSFGGTINKGGQLISNASTEFHTYTMVWDSTKMVFSVDGIVHYTYNPENKNIQNWPYDAPQYLLFNVAILPNIAASFTESAMEIDYVRIYQESTASLFEIDNLLNIKLFPNPVNDKLNIEFSSLLGEIKGTVYSLTGQKIQVFIQNSVDKTIEISDLSEGIYFLKLETEKGTSTHKIVKK